MLSAGVACLESSRSYYNQNIYNYRDTEITVDLPPGTYAVGSDLNPFYPIWGAYRMTLSTGEVFQRRPTYDFFGVTSTNRISWLKFAEYLTQSGQPLPPMVERIEHPRSLESRRPRTGPPVTLKFLPEEGAHDQKAIKAHAGVITEHSRICNMIRLASGVTSGARIRRRSLRFRRCRLRRRAVLIASQSRNRRGASTAMRSCLPGPRRSWSCRC